MLTILSIKTLKTCQRREELLRNERCGFSGPAENERKIIMEKQ
jgi:hypothetical protein